MSSDMPPACQSRGRGCHMGKKHTHTHGDLTAGQGEGPRSAARVRAGLLAWKSLVWYGNVTVVARLITDAWTNKSPIGFSVRLFSEIDSLVAAPT